MTALHFFKNILNVPAFLCIQHFETGSEKQCRFIYWRVSDVSLRPTRRSVGEAHRATFSGCVWQSEVREKQFTRWTRLSRFISS